MPFINWETFAEIRNVAAAAPPAFDAGAGSGAGDCPFELGTKKVYSPIKIDNLKSALHFRMVRTTPSTPDPPLPTASIQNHFVSTANEKTADVKVATVPK